MTFMCIIVVSHILHVPPNPPNFANSVLYTHARYSQFHTERGGRHKNASLKSEILEWCSKTIWHEKLFVSSKITPPYSAPFLPRVFTYPTYSSPAPSTATNRVKSAILCSAGLCGISFSSNKGLVKPASPLQCSY